jgi:hypothetical protein
MGGLGRLIRMAVLASLAMVVAGCLPTPNTPAVAPGTRACVGMPAANCNELFAQADANARARGTVVVGIAVRCTTVCNAQGGEAETMISYGDGTTEQGSTGWQVALPPPVDQTKEPEPTLPVAPTCVGVGQASCEQMALSVVMPGEVGHGDVVSIVVVCKPGPCTPAKGEGETTVTFADGQVRTNGWGYEGLP